MKYLKTYVDVVARIDADGRVTPLSIRWRDGRTFEIDRVHESIRRASARVGGTGIRYLVTVHGKEKFLFFEGPRWFVEEVVVEQSEGDISLGERSGAHGSSGAPTSPAGPVSRALEGLAATLRRRSHPPMPRSHVRRA